MPKEQINHPESYPWKGSILPGPNDPEGAKETRTDPGLFIRWHAGDAGHVQVALEFDAAQVREMLAADDGAARLTLWTGVLDREAINKAIRVLRRSRDQAYGRDE